MECEQWSRKQEKTLNTNTEHSKVDLTSLLRLNEIVHRCYLISQRTKLDHLQFYLEDNETNVPKAIPKTEITVECQTNLPLTMSQSRDYIPRLWFEVTRHGNHGSDLKACLLCVVYPVRSISLFDWTLNSDNRLCRSK
ncbi:hypothetical protein J6590_066018 [Homalodisca vitripennis]|nr:hypothetical protein J6590_066018 [Homalodisca vitripennis]